MAGPDRDSGTDDALARHRGAPGAAAAALALVLVIAHARLGGRPGLALTVAITVGAVGALLGAVHRAGLHPRRGWQAMAAALGLFGLGTTTSRLAELGVTGLAPFTMPLHGAGFALYVGAAMQLNRARRGGRTLADALDTGVLGWALAVAGWRLVWVPLGPSGSAGAYFAVAAALITTAVCARLLHVIRQGGAPEPTTSRLSGALVLASFYPVSVVAAATVFGVAGGLDGHWAPDAWFSAAWPLTAALLIAAGTLPVARDAAHANAASDAPVDTWRLALVGVAGPLPLVAGLLTDPDDPAIRHVLAIGIFMNILVSVRTGMAFLRTRRELDGRIAAEAELLQQARFDTLTGLPNRALFTSRLEEAVERAEREGGTLAVLYVDLDRFKVVNDSFGQRAGDDALVVVADRLRAAVRDHDTPARLSGDEFAVILERIDGPDDARTIAERIRQALREPVPVAGTSAVIGASVGLSVHDGQARATDLLREADVALSDAKRTGRNAVVMFDASLRATIAQALAYEHDLVDAAGRGELRLHYQPQIDLRTGAVCGVEALVRWQHPTQGLLGPGAFMDIAEDTGLIVPIGAWVIDEACRQHRRWQALLGADLVPHIAVNVSPTQLVRDDVAARVKRALAATRLDALQLHVEITEVALMGDPERAVQALHNIEHQGVAIAVDDFGTGYFSLSHLRRFPVHRIKIDQSFVRGIGVSAEDEAIIDATIDLAHALGLSVVAEGIETEEQLRYVRAKGCDVGQGYLFARPMPPDELARFLAEWARTHGVARNGAPDRRPEMAPITGPSARALGAPAERGDDRPRR